MLMNLRGDGDGLTYVQADSHNTMSYNFQPVMTAQWENESIALSALSLALVQLQAMGSMSIPS